MRSTVCAVVTQSSRERQPCNKVTEGNLDTPTGRPEENWTPQGGDRKENWTPQLGDMGDRKENWILQPGDRKENWTPQRGGRSFAHGAH